MSTHTARAYREGSSWVIDVEGVGVTQAATLDKVHHMARDLVAIMEDVDLDTVDVLVNIDLPGDLGKTLADARSAADQAARLQREAAVRIRSVVLALRRDLGLTVREVAAAVGVSTARAAQLLADVSEDHPAQARRSGRPDAARQSARGALGRTQTPR